MLCYCLAEQHMQADSCRDECNVPVLFEMELNLV